MEIKIEIPQYYPGEGIEYNWVDGFVIEAKAESGMINIIANKEGLISLATHLLTLAQNQVPQGSHLHYDEHNSLEENSFNLIIQKKIK